MVSFFKKAKQTIAKWPVLTCTTLTTIACLTVLFSFAAAGWPGKPNGCQENYLINWGCFCERPRGDDAWIKQPVNTLSNFSFCIVALCLAYACDSKQWPKREWWDKHDNFMTSHNDKSLWVLISFTSIASFLGPGSMFMHASQTHWGAKVDTTSMYFYIGWASIFHMAKVGATVFNSWDQLPFFTAVGTAMYVALMATLVPLNYLGFMDGKFMFEAFLCLTACLEPLLRLYEWSWRKQRTARFELYLVGATFQAIAYGFWIPSRSGGAMCYPDSIFQGHAIWHMLSAVAIGFFFLYHLSEHSIDMESCCSKNRRKVCWTGDIPDEEGGCIGIEKTAELSVARKGSSRTEFEGLKY